MNLLRWDSHQLEGVRLGFKCGCRSANRACEISNVMVNNCEFDYDICALPNFLFVLFVQHADRIIAKYTAGRFITKYNLIKENETAAFALLIAFITQVQIVGFL